MVRFLTLQQQRPQFKKGIWIQYYEILFFSGKVSNTHLHEQQDVTGATFSILLSASANLFNAGFQAYPPSP